jgi:hypothetical protein
MLPRRATTLTPLPFGTGGLSGGPTLTPADVTWHPLIRECLDRLPGGTQRLWGIPFELADARQPERWLWLVGDSPTRLVIPASDPAPWVVFAHFCGVSRSSRPVADPAELPSGIVNQAGQHLADYVLEYGDGSEHRQPIRRRYEVNDVFVAWGQLAFAAHPHRRVGPVDLRGPHRRGEWGRNQMGTEMPVYDGDMEPWPHRRPIGNYWLYALPNPRPDLRLVGLSLESTGADHVAIAGVTLCHASASPLRYNRVQTLRVRLAESRLAEDVDAKVDLGVIARRYAVPRFEPEPWLSAEVAGWGSPPTPPEPVTEVLLDVTASPAATLIVDGCEFPVESLGGEQLNPVDMPNVQVVAGERAWVQVALVDAATGRPTCCRVHLKSPLTGYLPPYGHRREVNEGWFEDYGADLKLGDTAYAYVDGTFRAELPIGDVYVEAVKGFEYRPLRTRARIEPGQTELRLELQRALDSRRAGWVTADTHVHFISPQTAWLEAQAEGLNMVHLLAAQWGDLFTNVGDYTGAPSGVSRDDTLVWVGAEHRQHLLGHMSLLGTRGSPVAPLSASGPEESYLGDPTWVSLSDWADACRERDGLVVIPHFPNPFAEAVASIVLGKVDAVEVRDFHWGVDSEGVRTWYRFLNCGYRVAAVGGTDKMSAGVPVGGVRTYANVGDAPLSFDTWAAAVRRGRTFSSSGPLLELTVEGEPMGAEVRLGAGGGTVEVEARAECVHPIHHLEIVHDGLVVAREHASGVGRRALRVHARVPVRRSGWIAARCAGDHRLWQSWTVVSAAHTSPVYLHVDGRPAFDMGDAAHLRAILEGARLWVDALAVVPDASTAARLRSTFDRALAALARRAARVS